MFWLCQSDSVNMTRRPLSLPGHVGQAHIGPAHFSKPSSSPCWGTYLFIQCSTFDNEKVRSKEHRAEIPSEWFHRRVQYTYCFLECLQYFMIFFLHTYVESYIYRSQKSSLQSSKSHFWKEWLIKNTENVFLYYM